MPARCVTEASSPARVLVFGGTGFIGSACVAALRRAGHDVIAVSRSSTELKCDLCNDSEEALKAALTGIDVVVNTVGVKRATAAQSWEAAHVHSVQRLLAAMSSADVRCLVHVTVAGLCSSHTDPYSATKLASENIVRSCAAAPGSRLEAIILQPSVVWGPGDDFSRNLAGGILHAPVFPTPVPAGSIAIVHVDDVAAAVVAATVELLDGSQGPHGDENGTHGSVRSYDVCGPEALTFAELVSRTAKALDLQCVALPIPAMLMVPVAHAVECLMADPPITSAQLGLLRRGVTGELAQTRQLLKASAPRKYTVGGCREACQNVQPLFGVSIRPLLRLEPVLALFVVVFGCWWVWVM